MSYFYDQDEEIDLECENVQDNILKCLDLFGLDGSKTNMKDIKKTYFKLCKIYHPDKNTEENSKSSLSHEMSVKIIYAYKYLMENFDKLIIKEENKPTCDFKNVRDVREEDCRANTNVFQCIKNSDNIFISCDLILHISDFYYGAFKNVSFVKRKFCYACKAMIMPCMCLTEKNVKTCDKCCGQRICYKNDNFFCRVCLNKKIYMNQDSIMVRVEAGSCLNKKIKFKHLGHEFLFGDASDLVIQLKQRKNVCFKRRGDNLYFFVKKITNPIYFFNECVYLKNKSSLNNLGFYNPFTRRRGKLVLVKKKKIG